MSTEVAKSAPSITEQVRPTIYNHFKAAAGSLAPTGWTMPGYATWTVAGAAARSAIYQVSEKAAEARRQIERVRSIASGPCEEASVNDRIQSIASSVMLIETFLTSPIPIPVASSGSDCGTTLFFEDANFYGDIEINGKSVEYYIRTTIDGESVEICDSEELEDRYIPPRLLGCLFSHYAR